MNVSRDETSSDLISLSVPVMKTPLITLLHLVTETLLSSYWMWPSSQFLIQIQGPDFTLCLTHIPEECKLHLHCVWSLHSRQPPGLSLISLCWLALSWECCVFKFVAENLPLLQNYFWGGIRLLGGLLISRFWFYYSFYADYLIFI